MADAIRRDNPPDRAGDSPADSPGNGPSEPTKPEHSSVRYESSDVSFCWIFGILVAAGVLAMGFTVAIFGFFTSYRDHLAAARRSPFPLAPSPQTGLPPPPRLEGLDVPGDLSGGQALQKRKVEQLSRYGKTEEGFVHIPVERAMKWLANQLPARPADAKTSSRDNGLVDGGEPNSGRLFRKRSP